MNPLVAIDHVAERSNTPAAKFVIVSVAPSKRTGKFDYDRTEAAQGDVSNGAGANGGGGSRRRPDRGRR